MKSTKYILLVIGVAGVVASFYRIIEGDQFIDHIIGIVCGVSLIFGFFELNKKENRSLK
jgi:multisubunit Na+/H+ antiporter MnhF subunit